MKLRFRLGEKMRTFWSKNCYEKNTELCFTTKLEKSENAEIRIIAKDVYNLFINGVFVHYGPARAAKGYARIDCVQIGEYLTQEENRSRELCFTLVFSPVTSALRRLFRRGFPRSCTSLTSMQARRRRWRLKEC